jgi:hypothetical protein
MISKLIYFISFVVLRNFFVVLRVTKRLLHEVTRRRHEVTRRLVDFILVRYSFNS